MESRTYDIKQIVEELEKMTRERLYLCGSLINFLKHEQEFIDKALTKAGEDPGEQRIALSIISSNLIFLESKINRIRLSVDTLNAHNKLVFNMEDRS